MIRAERARLDRLRQDLPRRSTTACKREDSVKDIGALLDWIAHAARPRRRARVVVDRRQLRRLHEPGGGDALRRPHRRRDRRRRHLQLRHLPREHRELPARPAPRRVRRRARPGDARVPDEDLAADQRRPGSPSRCSSCRAGTTRACPTPRPSRSSPRCAPTARRSGTCCAENEGHGFARKDNADFQFYATVLFMRETLLEVGDMAGADILALGEAMVEFNQTGAAGGRLYLQGFGGDTSNFAVAAARQGARTGYVSALGDDVYGAMLRAMWREEGVDDSGVRSDADAYTAVYFVSHDAEGHHFSFFRQGSAASRMSAARAAARADRRGAGAPSAPASRWRSRDGARRPASRRSRPRARPASRCRSTPTTGRGSGRSRSRRRRSPRRSRAATSACRASTTSRFSPASTRRRRWSSTASASARASSRSSTAATARGWPKAIGASASRRILPAGRRDRRRRRVRRRVRRAPGRGRRPRGRRPLCRGRSGALDRRLRRGRADPARGARARVAQRRLIAQPGAPGPWNDPARYVRTSVSRWP